MKLPITSWKKTLRILGFRVKPSNKIKKKRNSSCVYGQLEPRQMLTGGNEIRIAISNDFGSQAIWEGDTGTTEIPFLVTREGDLSGTTTVDWSAHGTYGSNSVNTSDFIGGYFPTGQLQFLPGETAKAIVVPLDGDITIEADEEFEVSLFNPSSSNSSTITLTEASQTEVVFNDDSAATSPTRLRIDGITPESFSVIEDQTEVYFEVSRFGELGGTTTVDWSVTGFSDPNPIAWGVAGPEDFERASTQFPSGSLTFQPFEQQKIISIPIQHDWDYERYGDRYSISLSNESDTVNLVAVTQRQINPYIIDDDGSWYPHPNGPNGVPTVSVSVFGFETGTETDTGTTLYTFTATRNAEFNFNDNEWQGTSDWQGTTTVNWAVEAAGWHDNQRTADFDDFINNQIPQGQLVFAPGELTKEFTIAVDGDNEEELDEYFVGRITSVTDSFTDHSYIRNSMFTGVIYNDDSTPPFPGPFGSLNLTVEAEIFIEEIEGTRTNSNPDFTEKEFRVVASRRNDFGFYPGTTTVGWQVLVDPNYADRWGFVNSADVKSPLIGEITIGPNESSGEAIIKIVTDTYVEFDEIFFGELTYALDTHSEVTGVIKPFIGQIIDDDPHPDAYRDGQPCPCGPSGGGGSLPREISVAFDQLLAQPEGDEGATIFSEIVVSASIPSNDFIWVDWELTTTGANPVNRQDFLGVGYPSGTVLLPPNQSSVSILVPVRADLIFEDDETFSITIDNAISDDGRRTVITDATVSSQIMDDDQFQPSVNTISIVPGDPSAIVHEGDSGITEIPFLVSREGDLDNATTVVWTVAPFSTGRFSANRFDFDTNEFPSGELRFLSGEAHKSLIVRISADAFPEWDEEFAVLLKSAFNRNGTVTEITESQALGFIKNDDVGPINNAPFFTSTPVSEATVGGNYEYHSTATDSDGDPLEFWVGDIVWPVGYKPKDKHDIKFDYIDNGPNQRGIYTWDPDPQLVGKTVRVTEFVADYVNTPVSRTFEIYVNPAENNYPPTITSEPATHYQNP
ncbi:MAG: Calx-beta domain-containing protein, partial [Planctomycetota bacterium]